MKARQYGEVCVLGCGGSAGVPLVGCECAVCTSAIQTPHSLNQRTRTSAWVQIEGLNVLIDTGPDLRAQALRERLIQVDAVLYTHPHADHMNGLDDLRAFCYRQRAAIPVYGNRFTIDNIRERFAYACLPPNENWDKPTLTPHICEQAFEWRGVKIVPIPVIHGRWEILGWRIGDCAWLTDLNELPCESRELLRDLDVLFLDCLRDDPYPSHLGVNQALELANTLQARRTVLIHMTHLLDYHELSARCPEGVEVAWDGMRVSFETRV